MIKTQVQIPDELYKRAKQIAKEREWSLAEVMRRGLEYMAHAHPPLVEKTTELPVLDASRFMADSDALDLTSLSRDEESLRGIEQ